MYCRPHHVSVLIALMCLSVIPATVFGRTLEVESTGKVGYASIQAAVDAAVDGDTIVIHPGTYTGYGNCDIRLQRKAIDIRSADPEDPSVVETTIIDCQGTAGVSHRGFYVTDFAGEISGLTITNGLASVGGAIYCENTTLVLSFCRIVDNATLPGGVKVGVDGGSGGGLYGVASAIEIMDCLISGNATGAGAESRVSAGGDGGDGAGLYARDSVVYVSDSTMVDNITGAGGSSDIFAGSGGTGGAVRCDSLVLTHTTIANNITGAGGSGPIGGHGGLGAGLYCMRATIERSVIQGNTAGAGGESTDFAKGAGGQGGSGGGVFCQDSLEIADSLVAGNRCGRGGTAATAGADGRGGGIWCALGRIDHCTIAENASIQQRAGVAGQGAGVFCSADTVITSSILWGNIPDQLAGQNCDNVTYCNIEGNTCPASGGVLSDDPLFVQFGQWADSTGSKATVEPGDPTAVWTAGDYRLSDGSPCIDAGDPDYRYDPNRMDIDGNPRASGAAVDMGAYEVQSLAPVYRFWSPKTGSYLYTAVEAEKDRIIEVYSESWTFEGVAYYAYLRATQAGLMPVYRFWSDKLGSHFYTIDEAERDKILSQQAHAWTYEGSVFYAYPVGGQPHGAKPVYRFWSDKVGAHFYTIDEAERQWFIDTLADAWTYEGVVWYAFDEPGIGETPGLPDETTLYEFSAGPDAASYGLVLKAYLDGQEARIDNPNLEFIPARSQMQMAVNAKAMTAELTEFHIESEFLQYTGTANQIGGTIAIPFSLYVSGFFDTTAPRGPYAIDPKTQSFPTGLETGAVAAGEAYAVVGSGVVEGEKFDVNLVLSPTDFLMDGVATFDGLNGTDRLDVNMAGPFQWYRQQQEDLLMETTFKGHVLQLYVTSARIRTTGLWAGKRVPDAEKTEK